MSYRLRSSGSSSLADRAAAAAAVRPWTVPPPEKNISNDTADILLRGFPSQDVPVLSAHERRFRGRRILHVASSGNEDKWNCREIPRFNPAVRGGNPLEIVERNDTGILGKYAAFSSIVNFVIRMFTMLSQCSCFRWTVIRVIKNW